MALAFRRYSFDYLQAEADAKRARIRAASSRRPGSGAQSVADLFTAAITLTAWLARSAASATDLLLHVNVPCAGGSPAYLEVDKLPDGIYRRPSERCSSTRKSAGRGTWRRWCGKPTRWRGADRSAMLSPLSA